MRQTVLSLLVPVVLQLPALGHAGTVSSPTPGSSERIEFAGRGRFACVVDSQPPATSADAAIQLWAANFSADRGIDRLDLREVWRASLLNGARTVYAYQQWAAGVPVDQAIVRVVVAQPAPRVVFASGRLVRSTPAVAAGTRVAAADAIAAVQSQAAYHLAFASAPELVIYAGEDSSGEALLAWRVRGEARLAGSPPDRRTFFVDAASGEVVGARQEAVYALLQGSVLARATPGTGPDVAASPPVLTALAGIQTVAQGVGDDVTDDDGQFHIETDLFWPANVSTTTSAGAFVAVQNLAGEELSTTMLLNPGLPGSLVLNLAPSALSTAQANVFLHATLAHDFFRGRSNFAAIDVPVPAYVNDTGLCNALFDGAAMHFYQAQTGCNNSAYSTIVAHEYGHFIVAQLGLGQGAFGEGFADALAMLLYETPTIAEQFYTSGAPMRTPGNAGRQYPCSGEIHYCGELLAGVWWDIRQNLMASYGADGHELACQLFVDWAQITAGGAGPDLSNSAHPLTATEILIANDDNNDLGDGTPDYDAISAAFAAHGITTPAISPLRFEYPAGLPDSLIPDEPTTLQVRVRDGTHAPAPGTGRLSYRVGPAEYEQVSMTETTPNEYVVELPPMPCGQTVRYYFSARTMDGAWFNDPLSGSERPFAATASLTQRVVVSDAFDTDQGWATAAGDDAIAGQWERGVPQGTLAQPEGDHSPAGTQCWITGAAAGSSTSSNDVDGGRTTLLSPVFDLSQSADSIVSYWRWYSNAAPSMAPHADVFDVEITNNLSDWTLVERVGPDGPQTEGGWRYHEFRMSDYVAPTSTVRMRFVASDLGQSSTIEAALDDFQIAAFGCDASPCGPGCQADVDGNCAVGLSDLSALLTDFGRTGSGLPGDLTRDGRIDLADLAAVLSEFGSDCR